MVTINIVMKLNKLIFLINRHIFEQPTHNWKRSEIGNNNEMIRKGLKKACECPEFDHYPYYHSYHYIDNDTLQTN